VFVERCSIFIFVSLSAPGANNQGTISSVFDMNQFGISPWVEPTRKPYNSDAAGAVREGAEQTAA
jgi:hypothetical protein